MLIRLAIRDIVLIDWLDIDFATGLSVLTGETGAGKSILLDAFALALGARGDAGLVRAGVEQGQVTAVFELGAGHPAEALLAANDIAGEDQLILRRVQLGDGRTRAFINDQPVSVQVLKALGRLLVEIHGQHDERALVDPASHRRLLDAYGGLDAEVAAVAQAWSQLREAREAVLAAREEADRIAREADWLRHAVDDLAALAPEPGEESALAERRSAMMQVEKVVDDLHEALAAVGGAQSPAPQIAAALRRLERRQAQAGDLVAPAVKAMDAALTALDEASAQLDAALASAQSDPHLLERIEERLFALRAAARKYNVSVDALAALAKRYADDVAMIDAGTERLAALEREADAHAADFARKAERLSEQRQAAAAALDAAVNRELKPLKLDQAKFTAVITSEPKQSGPHGIDRVEFFVRTNPGTQPGPLMKVASGGELARFLLALKVVIADRGSAPTLVFDEVDTAVGGAVSDAIGVRLARLGTKVQVLAVTHAPQVAARAQNHYHITKEARDRGKRVATRVSQLDAARRREEIARMLAGAEITAEARAAAERLITAAER
jgi:DNA repair protein RecN (Recombination protein N)